MLKIESFQSIPLKPELQEALSSIGFETPTPVQAESLPLLLGSDPVDFIGLAQTGTGKTAAYGLPMLQNIDPENPWPQALILCPTRELCLQVSEELQRFAMHMSRVDILAIYGGVSIHKQVQRLTKGVQVIVATPGRLLDHLKRGKARLEGVDTLIMDEADVMLEMGFIDDIDAILRYTPEDKQVWLFSATMPDEIRRITHNYMDQPVEVCVGDRNVAAENVHHQYYVCDRRDRFETLQRVIDFATNIYGIVFTRTKAEAQDTAEMLIRNGYNADSLHGDLGQDQRDRVMKMFRNRTLQLLVATDVAARGLDVDNLTHVIHYGLPDDAETYIHRSGRTARAGKSGISASIMTPGEMRQLQKIKKLVGADLAHSTIPQGPEVVERRMTHFLEEFKELNLESEVGTNGNAEWLETFEQQLDDMPRAELVRRLCWLELRRFMHGYADARDLNYRGRMHASEGGNRYQRFFINLGERDDLSKMDLLDWISTHSGIPQNRIHRVRLLESFSFFESFRDEEHKILDNLEGGNYQGRRVHVEVAREEKDGRKGGGRKFRGGGGGSGGGGKGKGKRRSSQSSRKFRTYPAEVW